MAIMQFSGQLGRSLRSTLVEREVSPKSFPVTRSGAINRRGFLQLAASGISVPAFVGGRDRRPNILFLMTDEHRGDALRCMGHPRVRTPSIDQLASEGVLFRNFFTASPVCSPARVSAFTGRYAKTHGVIGNGQPTRDGEVLLPRLLRKQGYRTGLAGKLHFHARDRRDLFDFHQELPGQYESYLNSKHRFAKGSPEYGVPLPRKGAEGFRMWWIGTSEIPEQDFPTTWIADRTIEFITLGSSASPWFCFTSFLKPHSPFVLPLPWATRYRPEDVEIPELPAERPDPPTASNRERHYVVQGQEETLRRITAMYYGAIEYVDTQIERILEALRKSGQKDNTIIVFTADHGNLLGDHGRMFKGTPHEGSIHVPGIFCFPTGIERGRTVNNLADTTCIMPTLLDFVGIGQSDGFESPSARGLMSEGNANWTDAIFTEMLFHTIRTERWKLTDPAEHPTWVWELFDLQKDPGETRNLYGSPEVVKVQEELTRRLLEWREKTAPPVRL